MASSGETKSRKDGHVVISEWADMLARKPGSTIVLWSGRAEVENSQRRAAGPAQVQLRLHPSPRVPTTHGTRLERQETWPVHHAP
jgi:hypothetical protein